MSAVRIIETSDLATCHAIRREVFIIGQNVPEGEEMDGLDDQALHLLALLDGAPVATARLFVHGECGTIGRVAVLDAHRGHGIGAALMLHALSLLREAGAKKAKLGAQVQVIAFYARLGFEVDGPEYLDAGIVHRNMTLEL